MTQIPSKPISQLEKKTWITAQDSILILDSETGEARLANKEELRGPRGFQGIKGDTGEKGAKGDQGEQWLIWPQGERWIQGVRWNTGQDGKNPEFQFSPTHIQYRLQWEETWIDLIPLSEIRGWTITNIARTEGTGAPGSTDTYTITLSDGTTQTFQVYNGKDGNWSWDMISTNNLSDLKDKAQARTNLEVYSKIETDNKLSAKQSTSTKNQANGYAGLDSNKKLDPSVIPVIATTETHTVANATARLALTPEQVQRGDYAIQTDTGEKYILSGENPASENDWTLVADTTPDWSQITNKPTTFAPASHTHTKAQVGLGNVDNTSDATKNSATATLTNKTISWDNNTITKVNSLKNLNGNAELKIRTGPTASIPTQQQAGVLYFGFEA